MNPSPFFPPDVFREVFVLSSDHALQLTNFRRSETNAAVSDGRRVFFIASANPFGTNPSENCQIFSIDPLGADLRQLTYFRAADHSAIGCIVAVPQQPGCVISYLYVDPETRTLIVPSNCDPLGTKPNGVQLFVMSLDGTGLRQLTATRGLVTAADGSVDVELAGGFWYQPSF